MQGDGTEFGETKSKFMPGQGCLSILVHSRRDTQAIAELQTHQFHGIFWGRGSSGENLWNKGKTKRGQSQTVGYLRREAK
jgi:hypothetical protein